MRLRKKKKRARKGLLYLKLFCLITYSTHFLITFIWPDVVKDHSYNERKPAAATV